MLWKEPTFALIHRPDPFSVQTRHLDASKGLYSRSVSTHCHSVADIEILISIMHYRVIIIWSLYAIRMPSTLDLICVVIRWKKKQMR